MAGQMGIPRAVALQRMWGLGCWEFGRLGHMADADWLLPVGINSSDVRSRIMRTLRVSRSAVAKQLLQQPPHV